MPNKILTEQEATKIARKYGFRLIEMKANLILANDYATREGKNAANLFDSYCSQCKSEADCEGQEAARNERDYQ